MILYEQQALSLLKNIQASITIDVLQIDQLSSVSVHLRLNLIEHAVEKDMPSALPNTIFILFVCM